MERKCCCNFQLTRRHTGAASALRVSRGKKQLRLVGLQVRVASLPVGHHTNRPFDNRFCAIQNPWPSNAKTLIAVARRLRKMNRHPENGSAPSFSRHNCASPSMPFLRSTGLDGYQDAHLRRYLNHADSHHTRLNPARSAAVAPFHWMRSLPRGPSTSIRHSETPPAPGRQ